MREEHRLDLAAEQAQPVFEVCADVRLAPAAAIGVGVAAVGEQARDGDQGEGGVEFLLHAALGPPPELPDQLLRAPVEFLDLPAPAVQVGQGRDRIFPLVEQRRRQAELGVGGDVFDQADASAPGLRRVPGRVELDGRVGFARIDERVEGGGGVALEAEYAVQAAVEMRQEHLPGVVAAVVDDDVALGGVLQMGPGGDALVSMPEQVEVDGGCGRPCRRGSSRAPGGSGRLRTAGGSRGRPANGIRLRERDNVTSVFRLKFCSKHSAFL